MAGPRFDHVADRGPAHLPGRSRSARPPGVRSATGEISSLTGVTGDREIAYTSLFARLVLKGYVQVSPAELKAAERAIVVNRFGGSGSRVPGRARARRRVAVDRARRDRGRAPAGSNRAPHPRGPALGAEIAQYQTTYSETPRPRLVSVTPAPSWLNHRRQGVAIDGMAPASVFRISGGRAVTLKTSEGVFHVRALSPTAPLGAFSLADGARLDPRGPRPDRPGSGLRQLAHAPRAGALSPTTCRRDWLPSVARSS